MVKLLDLPSEIRAIIIHHATSVRPSTWIHPGCLPLKFRGQTSSPTGSGKDNWAVRSRCPSLLLTCYSLHEESLSPIYTRIAIQLLPELVSAQLLIDKPGVRYAKSINLYIDACFPRGCVAYPESFPSQVANEIRLYLPQVTTLGLSIHDSETWIDTSQPIPSYNLEHFLSNTSWSSLIRRISLQIMGRHRGSLQTFLPSSRIPDPRSLRPSVRRASILSVPYSLVHLPELEELTLIMVTSLSAPGRRNEHSIDEDSITVQGPDPGWAKMGSYRYTLSDSVIRNRQNQDFVIALKMNEMFCAAGKDINIRVKRCIWTEGFGGYVVDEKTLPQYIRERWAPNTEFVPRQEAPKGSR